MATTKIHKVLALPAVFEANAIYMVINEDRTAFAFFMADSTGATVKPLETGGDVSAVLSTDVTAPDPTATEALFWWDPNTGSLFVKYVSDGAPAWVEAQPSGGGGASVEYAGKGGLFGDLDTVARSDHSHDSLNVESEW